MFCEIKPMFEQRPITVNMNSMWKWRPLKWILINVFNEDSLCEYEFNEFWRLKWWIISNVLIKTVLCEYESNEERRQLIVK